MRSNTEWRTWGRTDPLWGVAACRGKSVADLAPWTDAEFYELGARDWNDYLRHWEEFGVDRHSCVEIGCGAGRITRQLARYFSAVHAFDVSTEMTEYARGHAGPGIEYHVNDGTALDLPDGSVSAAFSSLVFRHFDRVDDGAAYFREIHRVLGDGGTFLIELPVHVWPSPNRLFGAIFALEKTIGTWRATYRRYWLRRGRGQPFFRRRTYEVGWLLDCLESLTFRDVEVRLIRVSGMRDRHWCVLGRK